MLQYFLYLAGAVILAVSVFIALRLILNKTRLKYYEKQGIPTYFYPGLGFLGFFSKNRPENQTKSSNEFFKKVAKEHPSGVVAVNNTFDANCSLFIYKSEHIKEYLLHEEFLEKKSFLPDGIEVFGFFMLNGDIVTRAKALFAKFFAPEGMEPFCPQMCRIIHDVFNKFIEKRGITKDSFTRIDLSELFEPLMKRIAFLIVFGKLDVANDSDEEKLYKMLYEIITVYKNLKSYPWVVIAPALSRFLRLPSPAKKMLEIRDKQIEIMKRLVKRREEDPTPLGESVIDRMIKHNRECVQSGDLSNYIHEKEMVGTFNLFLFAGTDTSQNSLKMAICSMTDPHLKKEVDEIATQVIDKDGISTSQQLNDSTVLTEWVKETLRANNPVPQGGFRFAKKDLKFSTFTLKKGDGISINMVGLNHNESIYPDSDKFDMTRFSHKIENHLPRYQSVPFGVGRRSCMGRFLGELMIRAIITQFCRRFDVQKPDDVKEYYRFSQIITMAENPIVLIKERRLD